MIISNKFDFSEQNKPLKNEKIIKYSKAKFVSFVVFFSLITIIYVSCVIKVNNILSENNELDKSFNKLINENYILQYNINDLESLERISKIAIEQMNMVKSVKSSITIEKNNDSK
jgi:cell division protein FtsL